LSIFREFKTKTRLLKTREQDIQTRFFAPVTLNLDPMTFILQFDLDILMHQHIKNHISNSGHYKQTNTQTYATENITMPHSLGVINW